MTTLGGFSPFYYFIAGAGGSAPVFAGSTIFSSSIGPNGSVSVNTTTSIPSGSIVFMLAGSGTAAGSQIPFSASDGAGNSYIKANSAGGASSTGLALWYSTVQIPSSLPVNQILSVTWSTFVPTQGFVSVCYSPGLLSTSIDKVGGSGVVTTGSATSVAENVGILSQGSELVLGTSFIKTAGGTTTSIITESAGFTTIEANNTGFGTSSCSYDWGYIITSTNSSISYVPAFSSSISNSTILISTFK